MLSGAVLGGVFASPSASSVLSAIMTVAGPAGCLLIVKNYTGALVLAPRNSIAAIHVPFVHKSILVSTRLQPAKHAHVHVLAVQAATSGPCWPDLNGRTQNDGSSASRDAIPCSPRESDHKRLLTRQKLSAAARQLSAYKFTGKDIMGEGIK
jgi:hypothetical protein